MSFLSKKLELIKDSPTIAVTIKAKELKESGKDVIGLGAGEPDFDTADNVKKAAIVAINQGHSKYTAVDGIVELKKAIQNKFLKENNINYELDEIIVGTGGKQVLYNAFMASLNEGDEVIIPAPFWVSYPDIVLLSGGTPKIVNCTIANNFKITPEQLEESIIDKTKWLILNSPSNPTGMCYTKQELLDLLEIVRKHPKVNILSDDIYEHLIYDGFKFYAIAELAPDLKNRILTLNGVSKAYAMTGWRIGYAGGNKTLIKAMKKLQSQSTSNPCSIAQYAALEAISGTQNYLKSQRKIFERRRDLVLVKLSSIKGLEVIKPQGAFYVFVSIKNLIGKKTISKKTINSCNDFASYLLEEFLVAVVSGDAFGASGYFRISYATSDELLEKACKRIADACEKLI